MSWRNTITVDIDVDDIIGEIDTEDLMSELKNRKTCISDLVDDPTDLKGILTWWFKENKLPPIWSHSDQEIMDIISKALHS